MTRSSGAHVRALSCWALVGGWLLRRTYLHEEVDRIVVTPDGRRALAVLSAFGPGPHRRRIIAWELKTNRVSTLAVAPEGVFAAFSGDGRTVALDINTWGPGPVPEPAVNGRPITESGILMLGGKPLKPRQFIPAHDLGYLVLSKNADLVASVCPGGEGSSVDVWDVHTGKHLLRDYDPRDGDERISSFLSDEQRLAVGMTVVDFRIRGGRATVPMAAGQSPLQWADNRARLGVVCGMSVGRRFLILTQPGANGASRDAVQVWDVWRRCLVAQWQCPVDLPATTFSGDQRIVAVWRDPTHYEGPLSGPPGRNVILVRTLSPR